MSHDFDQALENHDSAAMRTAIAREMGKGAFYVLALLVGIGVFIWVLWAIGEYGLRANLPAAESHMQIDPTFEGYWTFDE